MLLVNFVDEALIFLAILVPLFQLRVIGYVFLCVVNHRQQKHHL